MHIYSFISFFASLLINSALFFAIIIATNYDKNDNIFFSVSLKNGQILDKISSSSSLNKIQDAKDDGSNTSSNNKSIEEKSSSSKDNLSNTYEYDSNQKASIKYSKDKKNLKIKDDNKKTKTNKDKNNKDSSGNKNSYTSQEQNITNPSTNNTSGNGGEFLGAYAENQLDELPIITKNAQPKYPKKAERLNIKGKVIVKFIITKNGMPHNVKVVYANPESFFEESAIKAVKQMRFLPGKIKGRPVNTMVEQTITFIKK